MDPFVAEMIEEDSIFDPFDEETLHVYESSGISLGGLNIAHEYFLKDEKFLQTKILMKMIR